VRQERFAVYRNNVAVGLIEALRSAFPVVNRLVGDEFFSEMARVHALEDPPESPVLLAYGGRFPAYCAAFEPARILPYLADVATFEWLWLETFHAADSEPLAAETLQVFPADLLPAAHLVLHPSVRIARFVYPALTIWRLHQAEEDPEELELGEAPEHVLLVRPRAAVTALGLSSGSFAFLKAVQGRHSIAEAAVSALTTEPGIDLGELLSLLFAAGTFAGFTDPRTPVATDRGEIT
jgi:hypothetical protein